MSHTKQYELIIERAKDLQIIQMEEDLLSIMMDLESADVYKRQSTGLSLCCFAEIQCR